MRSLQAPRVAAIARLSAVDTVRARVTMAVNLGLLAPDEKLPPAEEMAEAFGVSRSSVVRGLTMLQEEGVVVRRAGRYGGSYVRGGTHHSADEPVQSFIDDDPTVHALIDERAVLEAGFAALAAQHRVDDQLDRMRELIERMAVTESWAEFRNLDRAFHSLVAEAAHTPRALPLLSRVGEALDPYFLPYNMTLLHDSNDGHRQILEAVAQRDAGRAATLAVAHVQDLHRTMYVGLAMEGAERGRP